MSTFNKRRLFEFMQDPSYRPLSAGELATALKVARPAKLNALLHRLEKKGEIVVTRRGRYVLPEKMHYVTGRLQGHARGFGFVIPEKKEEKPGEAPQQDIYIRGEDLNGAIHQDRVIVRLRGKMETGQPEGEIIRILERGYRRLVGTFERYGRVDMVTPDESRINWDIIIPREVAGGARSKDKVVVEIMRWPVGQRRNPEGKVIEVLGAQGAPGVDVLSIVRKYDLPEQFPRKVQRELKWVPREVPPESMAGRYDLRALRVVTIDGEDARDLDDAVSIRSLAKGNFILGVHIADVAHYVRPGTALDAEAYKRGTSVYLVDRVIPMLPPKLSNGICSLNPQVERLTFSVFMEFDPTGERVAYAMFPSVIRTEQRMTYAGVQEIIQASRQEEGQGRNRKARMRKANLEEDLQAMQRLSHLLRERRFKRGALDFDLPECKVGLDAQGRPVDLYRYPRSSADVIIEEFMLAANETVAWHLSRQGHPGIYRVHADPDPAKLEEMGRSLQALGYTLPRGKITTRVFQKLLGQVEGRPEERVVNTLLLRAMQHAQYAPDPTGHFGLAVKYYTHFTSPIRRYPDLIVHRILQNTVAPEGYFYPTAWRDRLPLSRIAEKTLEEKGTPGDMPPQARMLYGAFMEASQGEAAGTSESAKLRKSGKASEFSKSRRLDGSEGVEGSAGGANPVALERLANALPTIAEHASARERVAEEAERESVEMKKVEYMLQHLGEVWPGIVSGVTPFGLFVELDNLVEGLIHVASLTDDYYVYGASPPSLLGERTRRQFRIGDQVEVEVVRVDVDQRRIDFELVG